MTAGLRRVDTIPFMIRGLSSPTTGLDVGLTWAKETRRKECPRPKVTWGPCEERGDGHAIVPLVKGGGQGFSGGGGCGECGVGGGGIS